MADPRRTCSKCGEGWADDVIFCPRDGTPLGTRRTQSGDDPYIELEIGAQIRLERLVGVGAMGRVYSARQGGVERAVAVKVMHRELCDNATLVARFHRESKVASRLVHPNVVGMLMTGEIPKDEKRGVGGEPYLVMEFLDGISLRSALGASGGSVPLARALHVMLQVCDAVGEAHAQGIVHRDLKPDNVMLVRRGDDDDFVKLLDFGVARIEWVDSSLATQAGVIFGTARYISPEGARGERVDAPGDVYSIATMLFQCLSGETPFDGDGPLTILLKHTSEPPRDVRSVPRSSYVPEPLARVILANLAKSPGERCRDARELGRALVSAARDSGLQPDDLVMRSTLLGSGRALQLTSIERTKTLELTPDLARQLQPEAASGPAGTRISEPAPAASRLEPTVAGEPVAEILSSPFASSTRTDTTPPLGRALQPSVDRPSLPPRFSDPDPPDAPPPPGARRTLVVAACFVLGAGLSLGVAAKLGMLSKGEPGPDEYVGRARAALAAGRWDAPAGENVKDLTDTALQRWPKASGIASVRRDAAERLVAEARVASGADASRFARLALELDPESSAARSLLGSLLPPAEIAPLEGSEGDAGARSRPRRARAWRASGGGLPGSEPDAALPVREDVDAGAAGRWL